MLLLHPVIVVSNREMLDLVFVLDLLTCPSFKPVFALCGKRFCLGGALALFTGTLRGGVFLMKHAGSKLSEQDCVL